MSTALCCHEIVAHEYGNHYFQLPFLAFGRDLREILKNHFLEIA